jgi:hypothetical protein
MMHAAIKVTELHITWVNVLTAKTSKYVELPTFCTAELFHNATFFGSCIIHILHTGCAKI